MGRLRSKCPNAKILLLAILPRGDEPTDPARRQNEATNELIRPLADDRTVFSLDIGKKFLKPNGDGDVTIQPDMLHLSAKGYRIWAEAIHPTVLKLLGPRRSSRGRTSPPAPTRQGLSALTARCRLLTVAARGLGTDPAAAYA